MDQPATEDDKRWRLVLDIYHAASEIEPAKRIAFLKSTQCTDDVATEVLALLNRKSGLQHQSRDCVIQRVKARAKVELGRHLLRIRSLLSASFNRGTFTSKLIWL